MYELGRRLIRVCPIMKHFIHGSKLFYYYFINNVFLTLNLCWFLKCFLFKALKWSHWHWYFFYDKEYEFNWTNLRETLGRKRICWLNKANHATCPVIYSEMAYGAILRIAPVGGLIIDRRGSGGLLQPSTQFGGKFLVSVLRTGR